MRRLAVWLAALAVVASSTGVQAQTQPITREVCQWVAYNTRYAEDVVAQIFRDANSPIPQWARDDATRMVVPVTDLYLWAPVLFDRQLAHMALVARVEQRQRDGYVAPFDLASGAGLEAVRVQASNAAQCMTWGYW